MMRLIYIISSFLIISYSKRVSFLQNFDENSYYENECPKNCSKIMYHTLIIKTALNNFTMLNVPVFTEYVASVYYKCNENQIDKSRENVINLMYKLCDNGYLYCENIQNQFISRYLNVKEELMVDLRLPFGTNIKILTKNCYPQTVDNYSKSIFHFSSKSYSNFKYNGTSFEYFGNELNEIIQLSIETAPYRTVYVKFKIQRLLCIISNVLENKTNNKCYININETMVEGGYSASMCEGKNFEKFGRDFCKDDIRKDLCQNNCYNLRYCSYLCTKGEKEGGYIISNNKYYPDVIGSGHWKKDEIPKHMVLFNECESGVELCKYGKKFCEDKDDGYSCLDNSYSLKNCLTNKIKSPYWKCPTQNLPSKDEIMETFKNKTTSKSGLKQLFGYIYTLSDSKTAFNISKKEKTQVASFLLNKFVEDFSDYVKTNKKEAFRNDSFYYYSKEIDKGDKEINIPISSGSIKNQTEFINLELGKFSQNQTMNFFHFKNLDLMNEKEAIKRDAKNMKSLRNIKIFSEDYKNYEKEVLYKNSDMFSLEIKGGKNIKTIKYKLKTYEKVESYSWLYEVEHVCGFLQKDKNWTWSREGCQLIKNDNGSYCQCDHLSNLAMLFSIKKVNEFHFDIMNIFSLFGEIVNVLSLLFILFFMLFINSRDKLRIDHFNIAACLFFGTFIFLCGFLFSKNETTCSIAALVSQFLFLAAFVWKLILGINAIKLIMSSRSQNQDLMAKYRWVMFGVGYGIPLVIVIISGSMYWPDYHEVSDKVCWIDVSSKAFLSFIIPVGIIMAVNTVGLFFIANTLVRNYINTRKTRMNESNFLIVFVQLLVSMGLTWIPAYFAIVYLYAMYMFVIFFPLQGLLMFFCIVIVYKENREKVSNFFKKSFSSTTSTNILEEKTAYKPKSLSLLKAEEKDALKQCGNFKKKCDLSCKQLIDMTEENTDTDHI